MSRRILTTPLTQDPGSEAAIGYDYQWHIGTRLVIQMLANKDSEYLVCEFHEDLVQVNNRQGLRLVQVKKRESGSWTLSSLIAPEKKQKQGILAKLFSHVSKGKDICQILLIGYGKIGGNNEQLSLSGLIGLLSYPVDARDNIWHEEIQPYIDHLSSKLVEQGIEPETVRKAIHIFNIDFSFPHPDAIENENKIKLEDFLKTSLQVELTLSELSTLYQSIFDRVKKISLKTNQSWIVKSISRAEAMDILFTHTKQYSPAASRNQSLTTQDKLTSVGMGEKVFYAFDKRLDAIRVRITLDISSSEWENYRTEIDLRWREFRVSNQNTKGPELWISLRELLASIAINWSLTNSQLNEDFAEGIFFDMTGTCEAKWSTQI